MQIVEIAGRHIGYEERCFIIGEVAQAHDGSLGFAHAFIDAIANAGADAVKFQTHIASAESTRDEPWRVKFSMQDSSRYEYWKRLEFSRAQWMGLHEHAAEKNLVFLSSPFSVEAVRLLESVGIAAWKVASGEAGNWPMIMEMTRSGIPVILSSGMSSLDELDGSVDLLKKNGTDYAVMQATSAYPCPPEEIGLNLLPLFRERYQCPVGLSDHSGTIYPGLAGAAIGMDILEVHVTLTREMFGPDVTSSITTVELRQMVDGVRFIEKMKTHPVDKNEIAERMAPLKQVFGKSVTACYELDAGTVLSEENLTVKKPGWGIPARKLTELVGRRLAKKVKADQLLCEKDIEEIK